MTDNYRLATNRFKLTLAQEYVSRVENSNGASGLFAFIGKSNPWIGSDANIADPTNASEKVVDSYQEMVCGKKIGGGGIKLMAPRHDWGAGTVYTPWNHTDSKIFSKNFFSVVNAAAYYHVFKCLDNNSNAASQVPPTFSDTSAEDEFYQTGDGYVWKYMYSISKEDWNSFATRDFIPVIPNSNVTSNAVSGSIDIIKVESGGAYYSNYLEGQWISSDIQVAGNTLIYGISNSASSTNGYYSNCIITITEGKGKGQYREITNYEVSGSVKQITVNGAFTTIPDSTSQYSISPKVIISGSGQTINVVARALINAATSNSVYSIEILERGAGYRLATANIAPNGFVPVSNVAVLSPILPPSGGHGANAYVELGVTSVGISVTFSNTEANTISTDNDYRQIGLILDPLWANVAIDTLNTDGTSGSNGTFLVGETVLQANPMFLTGNVSVNTTSAVVTGTGTNFANVFSASDRVLLKAGSSYHVANVASVTNATSLTLSTNGIFTNTSCNIAKLLVTSSGVSTNVTAGGLRLTNVAGNVVVGGWLTGLSSRAVATVNSITISARSGKTFATFNQLTTFVGTLTSGTFQEDEAVYQGTAGFGNFHSIDTISGITRIYIVDEEGTFTDTGTITGNASGAVFTYTAKYNGDLVKDSGEILYLENISPVSRANNQSEVLKIVVEL